MEIISTRSISIAEAIKNSVLNLEIEHLKDKQKEAITAEKTSFSRIS